MEQKESRVWGDTGTEPAVGEEPIEGGEEYPAEWMNWVLWALSVDVDTLFEDLSDFEDSLQDHKDSTEAHGSNGDVAGLDDVSEARGNVPVVETLDDLPDADNEDLGTRYFVEEENQSYEVTQK